MRRLTRPLLSLTSPFIPAVIRITSSASGPPRHSESGPGIDRQDRPGDAPGIGPRGQKYVGAGKIARRQRDLQRIVGPHPLLDTRIGKLRAAVLAQNQKPTQIGHSAAGSDPVYPDAR